MERRGYYGLKYGGQYMPEVLMNELLAIENEYEFVAHDGCFLKEYEFFLYNYQGRETPLYLARLLSKKYGPDIYFKREDLGMYGSSRINHIAGQMIIGKRIGKKNAITVAPTVAHALSTASMAAAMEMTSDIFIGEAECKAQLEQLKVVEAMGSKVHVVTKGQATILDAEQEAVEYWIANAPKSVYVEHSALGPHPYPKMVEDFQKFTGEEAKKQLAEKAEQLPKAVIVPVSGNPASLSLLNAYKDEDVRLIAVEPDWNPVATKGKLGVFQGMLSLFLQDEQGELAPSTATYCDGLTYPGIEPLHVAFKAENKVEYVTVTREEAKQAALTLLSLEGIMPSVDSACALAYALKLTPDMQLEDNILLCLTESASIAWQQECVNQEGK